MDTIMDHNMLVWYLKMIKQSFSTLIMYNILNYQTKEA